MTLPALVLAALMVLAQEGAADQRIRQIPYQADEVVPLSVSPGYAAVVELGSDESIQNVVVGNSSTWQVTASASADRVIVKPLPGASATNMIVVTDVRRYIFMLDSNGYGQGIFLLKFSYPDVRGAVLAVPSQSVATYRLSGAKRLFPAALHDDGQRTTITWSDQTALPAVFAMADGKEAIVNGRIVGSDYVIEGTASRYVFRLGDERATASRRTVRTRP